MADELIEGVPLKFGRVTYVVPALNFKALRTLRPQMQALAQFDPSNLDVPDEVYAAVLTIVQTALKRNYPDITLEAIEDGFDLRNVKPIMAAIMAQSGLVPTGEAPPGASL